MIPRFAVCRSFAIDFFRLASASIDATTLARDGFGKLTGDVAVFFEVASPDRKDLDTEAAQLAEGAPHRGDVKLSVRRRVWEDGHEVPVAVRTVGLSGSAAEHPDLLGIEHLDDAVDDVRRNGCSSHAEIVLVEAAGVEGSGMDARIREEHVAPSTNGVAIGTLMDPRDQALSHAVLQAVLDGDYERVRCLAEEWRRLATNAPGFRLVK